VTDLHPVTALAAGVLGLAGSVLVPRLVARIPEPEPDPEAEPEQEPAQEPAQEAKQLYVDVAALPGLAWKSAVAGGVAAAVLGLVLGWQWPLLVLVALVPVSVALAVVDWRTRLLPTWLVRPTLFVTAGLVVVSWLLAGDLGDRDPLVRAVAGCLAAYLSFFVLWFVYPRGMGFGDVRLSGVLGLALGYLGWSELVVGIYAGFLLGGVIGGLLSVLRRVDRKGYPFGPFMLVGAVVGVVLGQPVIDALMA
jgi:leader peptidase (prepilin peptidase)/N-methyltransferase